MDIKNPSGDTLNNQTPEPGGPLLPADVLSTTSMRVGILEDEKHAREIIARFLLSEHLNPRELTSGNAARTAVLNGEVDLLLIDLGLGKEDGVDIIRRIRAFSAVPIIVVSGRTETSMIAAGLDAGADDYVRKPIAFEELGARIRSVARRKLAPTVPEETATPAVTLGDVTVDLTNNELRGPGGKARLTERESQILSHLLRNRGNPVSREVLSRALVGHGWDPTNRTLDVHVANIRTKLVSVGAPATLVRTRRNLGYQLAVPG